MVILWLETAWPSYQDHVLSAQRAEGKAALLRIVDLQEKFYLQNNQYATTFAALNTPTSTENGHWTLGIDNASANAFRAVATSAEGDGECATLTLDQAGTKGFSGTGSVASCW